MGCYKLRLWEGCLQPRSKEQYASRDAWEHEAAPDKVAHLHDFDWPLLLDFAIIGAVLATESKDQDASWATWEEEVLDEAGHL